MHKLRQVVLQVAPAETEAFFDLLKRRSRQYLRTVTITTIIEKETSFIEDVSWTPEYVFFLCNGQEIALTIAGYQGMRQTRRHAWIYYLIMKKLDERINNMADASFILSMLQPSLPQKTIHSKFRLSCTVAYLGALLRVLSDKKIIEIPNISSFCRLISPFLSTERQEKISPESLRNYIDHPTPEVLTILNEEFKNYQRYTEKFIHRQRL
jgi:hypothetical protein